MWNYSSFVALSTFSRVLLACRDEAILLVAGAINVSSVRLPRQSQRKLAFRVQHGASRMPGYGIEAQRVQSASDDRSDELSFEVWSDDGGHSARSDDDPGSGQRRPGGFRRWLAAFVAVRLHDLTAAK